MTYYDSNLLWKIIYGLSMLIYQNKEPHGCE